MKRVIALVFLALLLINCSKGQVVVGSSNIISQEKQLSAYDRIEVLGSYDVIFTDGEVGKIKIKAPDNILPLIQTEVSDGLLRIDTGKSRYRVKEPIIIYVPVDSRLKQVVIKGSADIYTEKSLETKALEVDVYGSGDVRLQVDASSLALKIDGSGDIRVGGKTDNLSININGSGNVEVPNLKAQKAVININGSGDVSAYVTENVDIFIAGSGDVTIKGNPKKVKRIINGSGRVSVK
jgi:hypothetical protein